MQLKLPKTIKPDHESHRASTVPLTLTILQYGALLGLHYEYKSIEKDQRNH